MDPAREERYASAGLLDGLDGPHRGERLELLAWLEDEQGMSVREIEVAHEHGTLILLAASKALGGGHSLSARDIAQRSGLGLELLAELQRANGLPVPEDPDVKDFGQVDLDVAETAKAFLDVGLKPDQVVETSRVLGRGLAQTADAMRQLVLELALAPGVSEVQLAQTYSAVAHELVPRLGPLVEQLLRVHLDHAVSTEVLTVDERAAGSLPGGREVSIGFADLVGFTRLGEELGPQQLEKVAERLTRLAADVLVAPTRLVKSIGDAVLLASSDPLALLRTVFALAEAAAAEGEEFPQLRIGLTHGTAVTRAGDWFGPPVNLASRLTGVARAGSVVTDQAFYDLIAPTGLALFSFAGERKVKGVRGPVKLHRARPLPPPPGS